MSERPPDDGRPVIGWKPHQWKVKIRCVSCNRRITRGVIHANDGGNPPVRAMCHFCYRVIMSEPDAPVGTPGFDPADQIREEQ